MVLTLSKVRVQQPEEVDEMEERRRQQAEEIARHQQTQHAKADNQLSDGSEEEAGTFVREERKVGRNEHALAVQVRNISSVMAV